MVNKIRPDQIADAKKFGGSKMNNAMQDKMC